MYYSVDKNQSGGGDNSSQTKNNVSREVQVLYEQNIDWF
ncbi:hypothetical protein Bhyg_06307 [Pseudolycoriella hygida]|uniref:Uncharacterized protein n=1 Tax=Pseudolycoriella hygida TaxID=35572 RepID=A0A9Q0S2A4_9DIPT|nr:hypothetical protein Bhyg_06307 [Pseudolycoriella hygida]